MLQSVDTLPENAIKVIAFQLLSCLKTFHNKYFCEYGGLSLGQIMFDSEFNVKLGISLSRRLEKNIPKTKMNKYMSKGKSMKK